MPREKMMPKAPPPSEPGQSAFERTVDLTRRLLAVPGRQVRHTKKKRKRR